MSSDQKVQVVISGNAEGLLKALNTSSTAVENMAATMQKSFGGITSMLEGLAAPLAGILGTLAAGHFLKEAISETAEYGDSLAKASQKVGVSVEALSGLSHAAKLADVSFEDLVGGMGKLAKNMQEAVFTPTSKASAAFRALGIEVQDSTGHLRSTDEVMLDVAEKFSGMKDSAGKTALAMNLFGKSGKDMIPLLNEGREGISELTAEAKRLGITMTTDQAEAAERYKDNLERVEAVVTGLKMRIGEELIPTLDELNKTLIEDGPQAVSVLGVAAKGLVTAFKTVGFAVGAVIQTIITLGDATAKTLTGLWNAMGWATVGQFGKAKEAISQGFQDAHLAMKAGDAVIQKDWEEFGLSLNRLWDPNLAVKGPGKKRGEGEAPAVTPPGKKDDPYLAFEAQMTAEAQVRKERLALWDKHQADMAELMDGALGKQIHEINIHYDEMLNRERSFGADESVLKAIELRRDQEVEQAKTDAAKKAADERKKIVADEAKAAREALIQNGTATQGFMDGLLQATKKYATVFEQWADTARQMVHGVQNSLAQGIQGILSGHQTLAQSMKAIWQGIVQSVVGAVAQMIAQWIVMGVVKKALGADEAKTDGARTAAALTTASAETWEAYAGIPFAGPILAAAQIAAMYASMAASTGLAAAAGATISVAGAADGGWFDRPTMAVIGEGRRPELVVPDVAFKDFAANLSSNILAQERQAQSYGHQASGYASAAVAQQAGPGAQAGNGGTVLQVTIQNPTILDSSRRGLRNLGGMVIDGARAAARERSVVLVPGQVFGGL